MLRRWGTALVLSIAAHLAAVAGVVGALFLGGLSTSVPIDVDIVGMRLDEVHDLPLGPPPGGADPRDGPARPRARRHAPKSPVLDGAQLPKENPAPDDKANAPVEPEAAPDEAPARASSLRQYGPEGSRVTALLRLDRLRATPYAPALDALLGRLPDRRDLLEGTGLDLFESFDALLIATPNPLDYTVTFLAARHHLKDADMHAALDRGAKATDRTLTWRTEGHRPFAERHARRPGSEASRDERLVVLPAPGLVVVTPPVYRSLLLAMARPRAVAIAGHDGGADGAPIAAAGASATATAGASADAGANDGQWGALLRRIDAEDGIMPPDAVAMVSATDLFSARRPSSGGDAGMHGLATTGTIGGMEVPKVANVSIGVEPSPFVDVVAEFADEEQARHWESAWPALHQKLKVNPYVLLTGFSALVARAELTRTGSTVHLRETATQAETLRLLQLIGRFMGAEPIASP